MSEESLVRSVIEGARLESAEEAEEVIRTVTGAMADHLPPEARSLISDVVSARLMGRGGPGRPRERGEVEDLFKDVGDRRDLGTAVSARYVRVVAEAIRREMTEEDVDRLDDLLADDFLALFEVDHRGELTEDDGATPGARILGWDEQEGPTGG